jgi:iron-sulfur cluster assembly protein
MTSAPPLFTLTDAAASRILALMQQREKPANGLRISVKSRGCTGLRYHLEYVDEPLPQDELLEDKGVRLYIDPKAVLFIIGTQMDFQEDAIQSGFVFRNPNEKGRCGCGESFHV